jgi:hypothetical protein
MAVLAESAAVAAVVFDAVTTKDSGSKRISTFSLEHTVGSGPDRFLILAVVDGLRGTAVTSITYGGISLTRIDGSQGTSVATELWGLIAPPSGRNLVSITMNSALDSPLASAISFSGVHQTAPVGPVAKGAGTGSAISLSIACAPGEIVLDASAAWSMRGGVPTLTAGPGQVPRWNLANAVDTRIVGSEKIASGSMTTTSWASSGGDDLWVTIGVSIRPSAAAGGPVDVGAGPDLGGAPDTSPPDTSPPGDAPPIDAVDSRAGGTSDAAFADSHVLDSGGKPVNLRVGTACQMATGAAQAGPGASLLAALALLAVLARGLVRDPA